MDNFDLAAAKRRNTIAELTESMRAAQRDARMGEARILRNINDHRTDAIVTFVRGRVGVWKGGCS